MARILLLFVDGIGLAPAGQGNPLATSRPADLTVLLTSDHGKLEDSGHRSHTRNAVPLLTIGDERNAFRDLTRIDEVTPRILAGRGATGDAQLTEAQ